MESSLTTQYKTTIIVVDGFIVHGTIKVQGEKIGHHYTVVETPIDIYVLMDYPGHVETP